MFTPRELRKELRVPSEWCVHCSVISAPLRDLGLKITSEVMQVFIINLKNKTKKRKVTSSSYIHIHGVRDIGKTDKVTKHTGTVIFLLPPVKTAFVKEA